jgi:hypothetical protein
MLQDYKPQLDTPKRQGRLSLVYIQAAVGATGAPTIDTANSSPRTTIARDSAGVYSITYPKAVFVHPVGACITEPDVSPVAADGKVGGFVGLDATGAGVGTGIGKAVFSASDDGLISEVTDGARINITLLIGN